MSRNTISISSTDTGNVVSLSVGVDGEVTLNLREASIRTLKQQVVEFGDRDFLEVYLSNTEDNTVLIPLPHEKKGEVEDFLSHYDEYRVNNLKSSGWHEFLRCWGVILDCIKENVDLEKFKVSYKVRPEDLSDCGGGLTIWMEMRASRGISWDDDFQWSRELNDALFDAMYTNGVFDSEFFSGIVPVFRPKYENRKDFAVSLGEKK